MQKKLLNLITIKKNRSLITKSGHMNDTKHKSLARKPRQISALLLVMLAITLGAKAQNGETARSLALKSKTAVVTAQLVANPFSQQCNLAVETTENTTLHIRMMNKIGGEVINSSFLLHKGNNFVTLPAHQLPNGFYVLQLRSKQGKLIEVIKGEKRG